MRFDKYCGGGSENEEKNFVFYYGDSHGSGNDTDDNFRGKRVFVYCNDR